MGDISTNTNLTGENDALQWFTTGIIVHENLAHLVSIHRSLLVMDVRGWAKSQADAHERDAVTATTEAARARMRLIGRDLRRWAEGDRDFLESRTTLWQCSVSIAIRANLGIHKVTEDNYGEFLDEVMQRTVPAQRQVPPTFLFVADAEPPELYVTSESAYLAEHAAGWIHRQVVSRRDLLFLFDEVLKDFRLAHEVAKEMREASEALADAQSRRTG